VFIIRLIRYFLGCVWIDRMRWNRIMFHCLNFKNNSIRMERWNGMDFNIISGYNSPSILIPSNMGDKRWNAKCVLYSIISNYHQLFVGIVGIDINLVGRTTVRSPVVAIGRRLEPNDARTDSRIKYLAMLSAPSHYIPSIQIKS
jgi:hypothetical protein